VEDEYLLIEVADTGCGIPRNCLKEVFKPYSRINANNQEYSGLGLGLALSKMFVELHGGHIWVESEENSGSRFTFTLPLHKGN
jgi:signal transduction histidine kinase